MATVREIRRRMKSTKNIAQITKAVEMVAMAKMRSSQEQALKGQPYSVKMTQMLQTLASQTDPRFHPLLQKGKGEKDLVLFVTPNRGLCGGLLLNLAKILLALPPKESLEFISVGKKGEDLLLKLKQKILASFTELADQPLFTDTLAISKMIIDGFVRGKYKKVVAIYPHFINTLTQKPSVKQILPIQERFPQQETWQDILYEPHPKAILEHLLPFYVELLVYHLILETIASEHSARMMAMKNATDNAEAMLAELTLTYNQVRQANITKEVAEIATARAALEHEQ